MSGRGMRGRKRSAVPLEAIAISQFTAEAEAAGLPVQPGKGALGNEYRAAVESTPPARFSGSVDLDAAFLAAEPREPRWDYGVGVAFAGGKERAFWIEPHPASSTGEVQPMLAKLAWLKAKLASPDFKGLLTLTRQDARDSSPAYIWLYAGRNRILPNSREARLLAREGLTLPRRHVNLP